MDRFFVGEWLVEPELYRLCQGDRCLRIERRSIEVLIVLAEVPGRLVSRRDLIARVWGDAFVTDDVLKHAIYVLRRALGDEASKPRYIETFSKQGYRLVAHVTAPGDEQRSQPTELPRPEGGRGLPAMAPLVLVLPCEDGASSTACPLVEGLRAEISQRLARIDGIDLVANRRALQFRRADLSEIQAQLRADYLIDGRIFRVSKGAGDLWGHVFLELVRVRDGRQVFARLFKRRLGEPFGVAAEIAREWAPELEARLFASPAQGVR